MLTIIALIEPAITQPKTAIPSKPEKKVLIVPGIRISSNYLRLVSIAIAALAFPEYCIYDGIWATAEQKRLFNRIFHDKMQMKKIIGAYLTGETHTEDYPAVEITIKTVTGTMKLFSQKQAPLLAARRLPGSFL